MGVSIQTLQGAIDDLRAQGILDSRGRAGTFVTESPMLEGHIALVFPDDLTAPRSRLRFWETLRSETEQLPPAERRRMRFYYIAPTDCQGEQYVRLVHDLKHGRLSGIVFATLPNQNLLQSELWADVQVPSVCLAHQSNHPDVQSIYPDQASFIEKGVSLLHRAGCKRPAILGLDVLDARAEQAFESTITTLGMHHHSLWRLYAPVESSSSIQQAARMLASLESLTKNPNEAPDSLIIADDNLVTEATRGLRQAREELGSHIKVVAYTNFPNPPHAFVPVMRVGVDVQQVINTATQQVLARCKSTDSSAGQQATQFIRCMTQEQFENP